jgi:hypothetical protein
VRGATSEAPLSDATSQRCAGLGEGDVLSASTNPTPETPRAISSIFRQPPVPRVDCVRGAGFPSDPQLAVIEVKGDDFGVGHEA